MLLIDGTSRQKYVAYLEEQKKKEADKVDYKRKELVAEIVELKVKNLTKAAEGRGCSVQIC